MHALSLSLAVIVAGTAIATAPAQNPVYRHNRAFYTSMWTTNPTEYTTAGLSVPQGTMHWRAFIDQGAQRREPRTINGIGTWWQPSDYQGTFPQDIYTPEFRFYPTELDTGGLVVPDLERPPMAIVAPTPMRVGTGSAFKSVTISLSKGVTIDEDDDFVIAGTYPGGANSTDPGYFGFLPSAANQTYGMAQSYYGFAYSNRVISHFGLGGARSSIWYTEAAPTLSVRANWAISDGHSQNGHLSTAWGDASYFSPIADVNWAGWGDSRSGATIALDVWADGHDGEFPLILLNFGPRFPLGYQLLGQTLEIGPGDPALTLLAPLGQPIGNGRFTVELPLLASPDPTAAGTYYGFEVVLVDNVNFALTGSTPSVWLKN